MIRTDFKRFYVGKQALTRSVERYEKLRTIGEGSYGIVYKCRNITSGQLVAIKRFVESESNQNAKKVALREIDIMKSMRHPNIIGLVEVFTKRGRLHLVMELCDSGNVLDELEKYPDGLPNHRVKLIIYQVLDALGFLHDNKIIHRDIKPENILLTSDSVAKLCDFGFARQYVTDELFTDYVATRWYRAPELLVGDQKYGPPVDVWAIGCVFAELIKGEPLFPGKSDIDQLHVIRKCHGELIGNHLKILVDNPYYIGLALPPIPHEKETLNIKLEKYPQEVAFFAHCCLHMDPASRWSCRQLQNHPYFNGFTFRLPETALQKKTLIRNKMRSDIFKDRGNVLSKKTQTINSKASVTQKPSVSALSLPIIKVDRCVWN